MLKTKLATEVIVRMPNAIGTLEAVAKVMADKGVNILGVNAWVEGDEAVVRVLSDDNVRVMDTLRAHRLEVREGEVLITELPHKPGMLHRISETLAQAQIDIRHLYATARGGPGFPRADSQ